MLTLRMARRGTTNKPFYHIVAADSRKPRDGEYLEKLGTYDPTIADATKRVTLNAERAKYWLSVGAQTSERVAKILSQNGLGKAPKITDKPKKSAPKKKSSDRAAAKAEKEAALKEAEAKPVEPSVEAPTNTAAQADPTPETPAPGTPGDSETPL
jgi:small subunit ribosomal protein S16